MIGITPYFFLEFIKSHDGPFKKMLDVGSLNVNGDSGTIKEFVPKDCEYMGIDMREGKNVDVVLNGHDLYAYFKEPIFDLITCFDTLEHDDKFWLTVENMREVLVPGGWLIIGVPSRYTPLHEHPSDYWRFMEPAFHNIFFKDFEDVFIKVFYPIEDKDTQKFENSIYGWGRKPL
mgnify:FL=1